MQGQASSVLQRAAAERLIATIGIIDAAFDSESRIGIELPGGISADLVYLERQSTLLAIAELMPAGEASMAMLAWLASANAGWAVAAGCNFSLPRASQAICLTTSIDFAHGNAEQFGRDFGTFVESVALARDHLAELADPEPDEGEDG